MKKSQMHLKILQQKEKKFITISNMLSILRIILVIPITLLLLNNVESNKYWAFGLGLIAILTDKLDGEVARRLNEVTEFGKMIDPLADKIAVASVGIVLTILNLLPLWFVIIIAVRDVLILLGGFYLKSKKGIVPQSNLQGKIAAGVISIVLILAILNYSELNLVKDIFITISLVMLIISFHSYLIKFFNIFLGKETNI